MTDVYVVGALHLDVIVSAERLPKPDETLMGEGVAYRFGGKGGNQALAAARMGASVAMAGRVGRDDFAETILNTLRKSGVDHTGVLQVPGATGMSVAIIQDDGEYGAVVVSGVNQTINSADINIDGARIVLLQNEIPNCINESILRAKPPQTRIILNAAPARASSREFLAQVDVLVANRLEAAQLTGDSCTEGSLEDSARALLALGPKAVVVTAGKSGAVLLEAGNMTWIYPPVQSFGSAHGAGDSFVGALAAELALGANLKEAAQFASIAAAHFVQVPPADRNRITKHAVVSWRSQL